MHLQPTAGTVPVHLQIADSIRGMIATGELQPGDSLPSVTELASTWKCSAGSARSALAVLREEGRITSGRGKASTVRQPPVRRALALSSSWSQAQKDMVLKPEKDRAVRGAIELTAGVSIEQTTSSASYSRVLADADLAKGFGLPVGTEILRREYEMTEAGSALRLSWSVSFIPVEYIEANPELLDERNEPWPGGHHHQLFTVGIEVDRFTRYVTAVQPTPGERQKWGMDAGVPMLAVRSKSIDKDGRVVELSDATYPADRTEIEFSEKLRRFTKRQLDKVGDTTPKRRR